jgi:hypothetical protein
MVRCLTFAICLVLSLLPAIAQESVANAEKVRPKVVKETPALTPEREAAVKTFVSLHHAELEDLLTQLKNKNPKQYDKAVKELFLTSERLAQLRESDPERYKLELQAWQIRSRVQLLTAKLTMSSDDALKQELKAALAEQYDTKHRLLTYDREKLRERMKKIEQDMNDHQAKREQALQKQYEQLSSIVAPSKVKSEKRKDVDNAPPARPN